MANVTVNENTTIELNEASKPSIPTGIAVFLSTLNILLSITASLGNALILVALHKETSLHPPTKLLFRCLAITDLSVGLIIHPITVFFHSSSVITLINWKIFYYIDMLHKFLSFVLCQVSILTSVAISVDRLIALLSGLRYRHVVTLPRVRAVITCFWLIGITVGSIYLWNVSVAFTIATVDTLFSLTTSGFSYGKIFRQLRHQLQVHVVPQEQTNGGRAPLNIARYKKSVSSAIWVQLALVTCYTPFFVVVMFMIYGGMSGGEFQIVFEMTATLSYFNSSLNPILYCWKIRSVRKAAKDTIKQLNCSKSAPVNGPPDCIRWRTDILKIWMSGTVRNTERILPFSVFLTVMYAMPKAPLRSEEQFFQLCNIGRIAGVFHRS